MGEGGEKFLQFLILQSDIFSYLTGQVTLLTQKLTQNLYRGVK